MHYKATSSNTSFYDQSTYAVEIYQHYRLAVTLRHTKFLPGSSEYIPHDNYGTLK